MAAEFNVSLATAFRHLRNGTVPATERRRGADGKMYPANSERAQSRAVQTQLRRASKALTSANEKAYACGIADSDIEALSELLRAGQGLLTLWKGEA